ncbi:hypothetical protein EXN66_Car003210 [Channa argus]|uniref:Ig-like domain-containing protein n=1 Tax=Channa argus TaxID=215402 RepID=A0A6G1PBX5_CHAAH|nr:hypothetical protein EXN66_Car003210 [Channa argus]KAK2919088.1 hypothetical protein Q8A73_003459 [Channa argus]
MQVVTGGQSFWIYTLVFTSLQLWSTGSLSASTCTTLPRPTLDIYMRTEDSVVLLCRAPKGRHGVLFSLHMVQKQVDSTELMTSAEDVQFTVNVTEGDSGQDNLFCCLYKDQEGCYSAFSPYLKLEHQNDAGPTPSIPSFPHPVLTVEPSSGVAKRGDILSFTCSIPVLQPQSRFLSTYKHKPMTFLLVRTAGRSRRTSVSSQPQASQVSSHEPQPGVFTVGPVKGGEEGEYTCLYQITKKRRQVNSTVSNVVQVTITDMLPLPTLVLEQQTEVWHLLCTGSPAYPGAQFSLLLADKELPVAVQHVKAIHHQATFPVPVQDTAVALYQCQYSVLLKSDWSHSERSRPLAVTKEIPPPSSSALSSMDLPLVLGFFSAVVLFLCAVAFVTALACRKVKAAAEKKEKRQETQLWSQVHAKDHIVDLTLRRSSFTSQEWASGETETTSRSQISNSLSTFSPIHPRH